MKKENVVIKRNTFITSPLAGKDARRAREGVLNKERFIKTPSSPLWGTSPARGEVNGGFTLIELLVVVLIIGILAAVALPQYKVAVAKSRVASILPIVSTLEKAAYAYYLANGEMTTSIHEVDVAIPCTETFAEESGKPCWTCGKDWLVQLDGGGVYASYCPGHNGLVEDCKTNRDYQIGYKHVSPIGTGEHYCQVKNSSAFGRSVCKTLSTGVRSADSYYIN